MEVVHSSEESVHLYRTIRRHISEHSTLQPARFFVCHAEMYGHGRSYCYCKQCFVYEAASYEWKLCFILKDEKLIPYKTVVI
jgi:hypothetical protein